MNKDAEKCEVNMTQQKAEQLRLPEQLYILLTDPETGEPRFNRERVRRIMATSVLWELLHCRALTADDNDIVKINEVMFQEYYLRHSALMASDRVPVSGKKLVHDIAAELHPIWQKIGEAMVAEHLLAEEVRACFCFFHKRVLIELTEARSDNFELSDNLKQAARNIWNPNYDDELAQTHPRLLARLILLDNYGLLRPLIGDEAYETALPYLSDLRLYLHGMMRRPVSQASSYTDDNTYAGGDSGYYGDSGSYCIYDSGADFWIDEASGFDSDGGAGDGDGGGGGGSDSGGGDGGGCSGCGGCGGGD